jgi:protein N-terminal asparagine amidohydrolase
LLLIKENNKRFLEEKVDDLGPVKCLYVGQREYATVQHNDPFIDIIGSDDATTCHIVLLVDQGCI